MKSISVVTSFILQSVLYIVCKQVHHDDVMNVEKQVVPSSYQDIVEKARADVCSNELMNER